MNPQVVVDYEITHPIMFAEIDLEGIIAGHKGTLF
jgi:hypothetical protein